MNTLDYSLIHTALPLNHHIYLHLSNAVSEATAVGGRRPPDQARYGLIWPAAMQPDQVAWPATIWQWLERWVGGSVGCSGWRDKVGSLGLERNDEMSNLIF